jgi:peptidoglycan/xylan/chitin deacetylase (PgdA/CDA1 family)
MNIFLKLFPSKSSLLLLSFFLGMLSVACEKNPSASSQVLEVSGAKLDGNSLPYGTVSLTFDDGPGPRTLELSRFLASHGIRATFFVQGRNVARYPGILWELHHNGHLIANHSYTQRRLSDSKDPAAEVRLTDELIRKYVRNKNFLFRAPADDWNSKIANILNSSGLTKYVGSISWDIGGTRVTRSDGTLSAAADWECWLHQDSVDTCLEGYMNETLELSKGIVLMHDVHSSTIDMVKLMVPRLKSEGFIFARYAGRMFESGRRRRVQEFSLVA